MLIGLFVCFHSIMEGQTDAAEVQAEELGLTGSKLV
jgi:hypothetical protein